MFINYLKIAFRNILKYRLYSAINIIGLSVGFCVTIMIILFVQNETKYDGYHEGAENIYRVGWGRPGGAEQFATFLNPVTAMALGKVPEIEGLARFWPIDLSIGEGESKFFEQVTAADKGYFEMFSHEVISGDPLTAIEDNSSAVITEAAALKFFGTSDVMGKELVLEGGRNFKIGAVIGNNPGNTHLISNIFIPITAIEGFLVGEGFWENLFSDIFYHYFRLAPGTDPRAFEVTFMDWMKENINEDMDKFSTFHVTALSDIHFTQDLQNEIPLRDEMTGIVKPRRQSTDLNIFIIVAVLTISIAAFNYMNLQIAQASKRIKEVGVRKVFGAGKTDVAKQFLVESMGLALLSFIGAIALTELLLPYFGALVTADLSLNILGDFGLVGSMLLGSILVGLVSGLYPALFIAGLLPSRVLRGELTAGSKASKFRAGLVVVQFAISIGLISAGGIINKQLEYAFTQSLGYNGDQVAIVDLNRASMRQSYEAMKIELLKHPSITHVTASSVFPTMDLSDGAAYTYDGGDPEAPLAVRSVYVGYDFFETLGMTMVTGRGFSEDFTADVWSWPSAEEPTKSNNIILNETAARNAGWSPEEALGQVMVQSFTRNNVQQTVEATVVGVVRDSQYRSVRTEIVPIAFTMWNQARAMGVKIEGSDIQGAMDHINNVWDQNIQDYSIRTRFLDDEYSALYDEERQTSRLFMAFSFIAIFIASMGLYGLASFTAEQRTKEIGVRKVLGATVNQIVQLLSWDFSKLVLVANLIGWPLAWFAMEDWLTSFAFRTEISITPFIVAGVAAFVLAFLTISIRAFKAARQNPVLSLRHE